MREEHGGPYELDEGSIVEQRLRPGNEKEVVDQHRDEEKPGTSSTFHIDVNVHQTYMYV